MGEGSPAVLFVFLIIDPESGMFVAPRKAARLRARRRRLTLESLARRELLAVGDFCTAGTPEMPAGQIGSITIDAIPTVSIADGSVAEGDAGASVMSFAVTLSEAPDDQVTIDVATANDTATGLRVDRVASGLSRPIFATAPVGDFDRLFVVEQRGDIEILQLPSGQKNSTPFLSIGGLATGNEQGLLGLAFHPDYANNGLFYVNVTVAGGDTQIREYQVSGNADIADPASARTLLTYDQPFSNHNGGWMGFGPDGYLYISSGDGGSGNDPGNRAQDITNQLLGKMLRIDVNGDDFPGDANRNYSIPASNPFVGVTGDDEIWAYGLRNPWRSSFDRDTGDLYIGDVGQNNREEIDVQPAASSGGENYGWRLREGTIETPTGGEEVGGPKPPGAIDPIYDYPHNTGIPTGGISVTGGYVYRGPIEELQGNYFFGDYLGRVWSLRFNGDDPSQHDGTNYDDFVEWNPLLNPTSGTINQIPSFGEDAAGNLYILDLGGEIFTLTEGADYLPHTETLTFDIGGPLTQTFEVQVLGDRLSESNEAFSVTLSNVSGATLGGSVAAGTIQDNDPPSVESIVINDGGPGRSQITSLAVTFDNEVNLTGSAFVLTNLDTQAALTTVQTSISVDSGRTVAVLTFGDGTSVAERDGVGELANSLEDGRYRLDVIASEVSTTSGGIAMASSVSLGDQAADGFFRLYGDDDGSGVVNLFDFAAFRASFGLGSLAPGFNAGLDEDGNGIVDLFDFAAFRANFGRAI